jgi:hypothetical protein
MRTEHQRLARQAQGRGTSARRAVVRLGVARRSGATRRQGLGCPRWRARSLARVRAGVCTRSARKAESHLGDVRTWVGQGEQRGSTPRMYAFAFVQTSTAWPWGDTKPTARARRRHRDKSMTSKFRRGGVQGQGGQKGSNLGSMARRTHVRRCVGVCGDGTAECRVRSQIGEAGARPLGCVCSCAC